MARKSRLENKRLTSKLTGTKETGLIKLQYFRVYGAVFITPSCSFAPVIKAVINVKLYLKGDANDDKN